ncbi:MAG: tetratricopeptide repeat protein [Acidobacteria bacterium]|nr:tetratricopeptide repeat protein [Acidobacteriota bacterium]
MRPLTSLLKAMALSRSGVRDLTAENPRVLAAVILSAGAAVWVLANVPFLSVFSIAIQIIALLLFVAFLYVPVAIVVCNLLAGDGLSLQISRSEYDSNFVSLASLLGVVLLGAAMLGWIAPFFGLTGLFIGYLVYVPFVLKETNSLPWTAGAAAALILLATWPLALLAMSFLFALPFFILAGLLFFVGSRFSSILREQRLRRKFEERLQQDLINPHDADAYYQLGWLYLSKRRFRQAEEFFRKAVDLQSSDVDYHYGVARAQMEQERWMDAFESLEKIYQVDPHYQMGDVLRDLGRVYFHLSYRDQAEQFLRAFLRERASDAEGKYWLARVLIEKGDVADARQWLKRLADRVETPVGFRKMETRYWRRLGRKLAASLGNEADR